MSNELTKMLVFVVVSFVVVMTVVFGFGLAREAVSEKVSSIMAPHPAAPFSVQNSR
jgi:hypothetical protein